MTNVELTITVLIYLASLLLGQRTLALAMPEAQEGAFAIAAIFSVGAAGVFYYRRERLRPSASVLLNVGGLLAIAVIVLGMFSQLLWQMMLAPSITLPIAAVCTLFLPFALFPVAKRLSTDDQLAASELHAIHVIVAGVAALICAVAAFAIPAPARSTVRLVEKQYPGLQVDLPDWAISQNNALPDYGSIILADPGGYERYMALHWTSGDPVQPDDYVKIITGGQLPIVDRTAAIVSGHEAVTYFLQSVDKSQNAYATIWNCPNDHRILWLFSYLNGPRNSIKATHERVLDSVHCHLKIEGPTTRALFPRFIPPARFARDTKSLALLFIGPQEQTIVLDSGISGRSPLLAGDVPDDAIANQIKQLASLDKLQAKPTVNTVHDLLGHDRKVWSAAGYTSSGSLVQVEVMVWYCDVRDMTFVGAYATRGAHPIQQGIDTLLPAACHEVK